MYGITLIELLTRDDPYPGETPMDVAIRVVRDGYQHPVPNHCPQVLAEVLSACWSRNPEDRPTFQAIYNRLVQMNKRK